MTDEWEWPLCKEEFEWVWKDGKPVENTCDGRTTSGPGGGIVCPKCGKWFCY